MSWDLVLQIAAICLIAAFLWEVTIDSWIGRHYEYKTEIAKYYADQTDASIRELHEKDGDL